MSSVKNEPSVPPPEEVLWIAEYAGAKLPRFFPSRTWFDARRQACISFGCSQDQVRVRRA